MKKRKVNVVHYPKSAGRTVEASLAKHFEKHLRLNGNPLVPLEGNNNRNVMIFQWIKALISLIFYREVLVTGHYIFFFKNAFNVLVVRDPEGVFESSFNFFCEKNPENCDVTDVEAYVNHFRFGNYEKLGKYKWDYVVFYDSFDQDLKCLGYLLGIGDLEVETRNVTKLKSYRITEDVRESLSGDIKSYRKLLEKHNSAL